VLYKRAVNQISVDLDGEIAILNLDTKLYFGLTDVGALIWDKLEEPSDLKALCSAVSATFNVGEEQCASDVESFLAALDKARLLIREP
jgi:hypothetical protein